MQSYLIPRNVMIAHERPYLYMVPKPSRKSFEGYFAALEWISKHWPYNSSIKKLGQGCLPSPGKDGQQTRKQV